MAYFVISDSGGGIRIDGPKTLAEVSAMLRDPDEGGYFSRDPEVVASVPTCDSGYFYLDRDRTKVLVIRGEIVTGDELTACPCGGGQSFKVCHGAQEEQR